MGGPRHLKLGVCRRAVGEAPLASVRSAARLYTLHEALAYNSTP
jgi:hypothetical protein